MSRGETWIALCLLSVLCATPGVAQQKAEPEDPRKSDVQETVVVTASRTEQRLSEVPASMTVLTSKDLEQTPADDFGDYLRNVPGLNVSQMSARDIQVTGRAATNSLATSQLVLLDNRSLYLDFFGFVMWDFAPVDPNEIKQIEVVRGPGSAVWGANAMSGVINLITKSPKEMVGTTVMLGGGELGTINASVSHAGVRGKLGYKLSASYYEQEPYDRPTGPIQGNPFGTLYPPFVNEGTEQPKFNARFDYDQDDGTTWSFAGGMAETDGIIHSGIGPFNIDKGTGLGFAKIDWSRQAARVTFFANLLDGEAKNLLTVGADGNPLNFLFDTKTYNLDFSNTSILGTKNILTYGATVRKNDFELSIAPEGSDRNEVGFFIQDELLLGDRVRWLFGARWDDLDVIDAVVSPRTSLLVKASDRHTFRASFNRAFRAPSMVNNFLDVRIFNRATFPPSGFDQPFDIVFSSDADGNRNLDEERLDAIEIGYVGTFGMTTFTAAVYRNETTDSIDFFTSDVYPVTPPDPAAGGNVARLGTTITSGGFTVCTAGTLLQDCNIGPGTTLYDVTRSFLAHGFSYRNIGKTVDRGVELTLNVNPSPAWSFFVNYSWQDQPDVSGISQVQFGSQMIDEVNQPAEHRANTGFAYAPGRWNVSVNVNYNDEAFWTDVLDSRFWGDTDSFTQVNVSGSVNLSKVATLSINAQNVFDEDVLQHVFGDLISRKVTGVLRFRFD